MILVVEDKESVRSGIRHVLERKGYRIFLAKDGEEATALWKENRDSIKLLLTDVVMPRGITGIDLAWRLRQDRPDLKVIFCSGYGSEVIGHDVLSQPGNIFVAKPFDAARLAAIVAEALA